MAKSDRIIARVQYFLVNDYLAMGYVVCLDQRFFYDYQHLYGIFMEWLCECPPPSHSKADSDVRQDQS